MAKNARSPGDGLAAQDEVSNLARTLNVSSPLFCFLFNALRNFVDSSRAGLLGAREPSGGLAAGLRKGVLVENKTRRVLLRGNDCLMQAHMSVQAFQGYLDLALLDSVEGIEGDTDKIKIKAAWNGAEEIRRRILSMQEIIREM